MSLEHETLASLFSDIADAIRSKTGSNATIKADNFPDAIDQIDVHQGVEPAKTVSIISNSQAINPSSGYSSMLKVTANVRAGVVTLNADYTTLSSAGSSPTSVTSQYFKITPKATVGTSGWVGSISDGSVKNYTVRSAATIALVGVAVTDAVTVGTESSGYYPINAKIKGNVTVGTSGWYTGSSNLVASANSQVGKIAKATFGNDGPIVGCNTAGYIPTGAIYTMPLGTEGTPTSTKGTASNYSISVTPSVTNVAGYIEGGTHTGTAVTVSPTDLGLTKRTALSKSGGTISLAANSYNTGALSVTVTRSDLGITDKAAATYNPSTSDQTISSGYYLTGAQTIKGITPITNSTYSGYLTSSTTARATTIKTFNSPTTSDIYIYPTTDIYTFWDDGYGIKISKPTQMTLPTGQNYTTAVGDTIGSIYAEPYETWLNIPAGYNPTPQNYVINPASASIMMGTFEIQLGSDPYTREVYPIPVNPATDWLEIIMNTITFQGWDIGKSGGNIYLDTGPNQGMVLYDAKANVVDASENVIAGEIYYFDWE